ncbi:hypothetical protein CDG81_00040 [Actinopolyspora erythraea]|uniref:DUF3566 domain-containing protein n=1 Tax=Actinopolyspora erythraea TaxID=414996 RepID=A0A099D9U4_9ACTN|nr:DUF3566 domain-containing protein [Actinopolyspora erythraea]ASU76990.1 hypothetical protein CDG81_00040 [Actinopolyspora erythraea]KGI82943.1 hypothetical protein IL38_01635 [Actinopolyspora erythraea]
MTSSDKPQEPESRSTGEQETTSTTTKTEATATSVSEGMSTDAADSGGSARGSASGAQESRGEDDGSGVAPPWQRVSGAVGTSADSAGASTASEDQDGRGGGTAEPEAGYEEEETHRIPHPADSESRSAGDGSSAESPRSGLPLGGGVGARGGAAGQGSPRRPSRGPRRASLQIRRVDPWSVLKLALMLSVTLFFVWMIAVAVLYGVLGGMGVWEQLNGTFSELTQPENSLTEPLISPMRVFGVASLIGAVNIVLFTALATVAGFIYNVAADFVGGVEVTLSERE